MSESILGMKVVSSQLIQPVPRLQLSNKCPCSDVVRDEFNAWLKDMFGTYTPLYVIGDKVILSPKHMAMLKL